MKNAPKKFLWKTGLTLNLVLSASALAGGAPAYDQLHPYYAEFCAVTQLSPLHGKKGGVGGHGVIYLKGACRDTSRGYPRLKVCDESLDLSNPESGAAISVDQNFKNVNWVGMDGKEFLITGGVSADEPLNEAVQEKIIQTVLEKGLFDGIEFHEEFLKSKPANMSAREWGVRDGVSTDFAMNFGRKVYCSRLPIKKEMLFPMVDELNHLNDEYHYGSNYDWSGIYNNCTHTAHNTLAAAGIWRPYGTTEPTLIQAFNLAIPANEYIDLTELGNDASLDDVVAFYNDRYKRVMLMDHDWVATQPGVLIENFGIHSKENSLYQQDSTFFVLEYPLIKQRTHVFNRILLEDRYSDLRANLLTFREKYKAALRTKSSISELKEQNRGDAGNEHPELDTEDFKRFHVKYYQHLEKALAEVEAQLALMR